MTGGFLVEEGESTERKLLISIYFPLSIFAYFQARGDRGLLESYTAARVTLLTSNQVITGSHGDTTTQANRQFRVYNWPDMTVGEPSRHGVPTFLHQWKINE